METLTGWLTFINLFIMIAGPLGGIFIFRSSLAKAKDDVQERVREALEAENDLQQKQIDRLERTLKRMEKILNLIASTLKKTHNIELTIDEDIVILRDIKSGSQHSVRISGSLEQANAAKVRPIRLQPIAAGDNDDDAV
jgi:hypothetical protein